MTDAKLTRLLAERVMGWQIWEVRNIPKDRDWFDNPANYPHVTIHEDEYILWEGDKDGLFWSPLTSMDDAWMVVRKLQEQSLRVALVAYSDGDNGCQIRDEHMRFLTAAESRSPQRAICLAAMKAVEG